MLVHEYLIGKMKSYTVYLKHLDNVLEEYNDNYKERDYKHVKLYHELLQRRVIVSDNRRMLAKKCKKYINNAYSEETRKG